MQKRTLGKTGYNVSEIGLGCWQLGGGFGPVEDQTATEILDQANALGVNFWDTADVYGGGQSETRIGKHPKNADVLVATKLGRNGELFPDSYSKQKVRESLEGSVKRLGVETLDLAQLHCVSIEVLRDGAIFDWMEEFQRDGLVRYYGASVETVEQAKICLERDSVATLQIIFNMLRQEMADEILPRAAEQNVGIIVRLPLASGLLSGKMTKSQTFDEADHRNFNRDGDKFFVGETFAGLPFETGVDLVDELKTKLPEGAPLAQLALRWILDHPQVSSVIAGVSKTEQLASNVAATELTPFEPKLMEELSTWYRNDVRPNIRGDI
ncbi:oxidoreductase [Devosia pacifica]|uniref:Oxidoreductase n=1 Tax=Devosia pacifica TaxID=1335967 RepID=A0A918SFD3_9HYPH|nr:aldo/keto reductase [Devosia pacifica]GHA37675.1 oxidoreductase [Devosia pacifica]